MIPRTLRDSNGQQRPPLAFAVNLLFLLVLTAAFTTHIEKKGKRRFSQPDYIHPLHSTCFSKGDLANLIILVRKAKGGGMHAHFWINFHQCQRACVWKVAAQANPPSAKTREK